MEEDTYWSNIFKKEEKEEKSIYTVLSRIPIASREPTPLHRTQDSPLYTPVPSHTEQVRVGIKHLLCYDTGTAVTPQ